MLVERRQCARRYCLVRDRTVTHSFLLGRCPSSSSSCGKPLSTSSAKSIDGFLGVATFCFQNQLGSFCRPQRQQIHDASALPRGDLRESASILRLELIGQSRKHFRRPRMQALLVLNHDDTSDRGSVHVAACVGDGRWQADAATCTTRPRAITPYDENWLLSASSSNCHTSSGFLHCFNKRQNVSSRSCREMFSNARK